MIKYIVVDNGDIFDGTIEQLDERSGINIDNDLPADQRNSYISGCIQHMFGSNVKIEFTDLSP